MFRLQSDIAKLVAIYIVANTVRAVAHSWRMKGVDDGYYRGEDDKPDSEPTQPDPGDTTIRLYPLTGSHLSYLRKSHDLN